MNIKSLTSVLVETNGDPSAVGGYFAMKRKLGHDSIVTPICTVEALHTLRDAINSSINEKMKRTVSLIVLCVFEFASFDENREFWSKYPEDTNFLLMKCLNFLSINKDEHSIRLLKKYCSLLIMLSQQSQPLSSLIFCNCAETLLKILFRKDLRSDVLSTILDALDVSGQACDAMLRSQTYCNLEPFLTYLAKMIYHLPIEEQTTVYSLLRRSVKNVEDAQLKALLWFSKYPYLQRTFVVGYREPYSKASGNFVNELHTVTKFVGMGDLSGRSSSIESASRACKGPTSRNAVWDDKSTKGRGQSCVGTVVSGATKQISNNVPLLGESSKHQTMYAEQRQQLKELYLKSAKEWQSRSLSFKLHGNKLQENYRTGKTINSDSLKPKTQKGHDLDKLMSCNTTSFQASSEQAAPITVAATPNFANSKPLCEVKEAKSDLQAQAIGVSSNRAVADLYFKNHVLPVKNRQVLSLSLRQHSKVNLSHTTSVLEDKGRAITLDRHTTDECNKRTNGVTVFTMPDVKGYPGYSVEQKLEPDFKTQCIGSVINKGRMKTCAESKDSDICQPDSKKLHNSGRDFEKVKNWLEKSVVCYSEDNKSEHSVDVKCSDIFPPACTSIKVAEKSHKSSRVQSMPPSKNGKPAFILPMETAKCSTQHSPEVVIVDFKSSDKKKVKEEDSLIMPIEGLTYFNFKKPSDQEELKFLSCSDKRPTSILSESLVCQPPEANSSHDVHQVLEPKQKLIPSTLISSKGELVLKPQINTYKTTNSYGCVQLKEISKMKETWDKQLCCESGLNQEKLCSDSKHSSHVKENCSSSKQTSHSIKNQRKRVEQHGGASSSPLNTRSVAQNKRSLAHNPVASHGSKTSGKSKNYKRAFLDDSSDYDKPVKRKRLIRPFSPTLTECVFKEPKPQAARLQSQKEKSKNHWRNKVQELEKNKAAQKERITDVYALIEDTAGPDEAVKLVKSKTKAPKQLEKSCYPVNRTVARNHSKMVFMHTDENSNHVHLKDSSQNGFMQKQNTIETAKTRKSELPDKKKNIFSGEVHHLVNKVTPKTTTGKVADSEQHDDCLVERKEISDVVNDQPASNFINQSNHIRAQKPKVLVSSDGHQTKHQPKDTNSLKIKKPGVYSPLLESSHESEEGLKSAVYDVDSGIEIMTASDDHMSPPAGRVDKRYLSNSIQGKNIDLMEEAAERAFGCPSPSFEMLKRNNTLAFNRVYHAASIVKEVSSNTPILSEKIKSIERMADEIKVVVQSFAQTCEVNDGKLTTINKDLNGALVLLSPKQGHCSDWTANEKFQ